MKLGMMSARRNMILEENPAGVESNPMKPSGDSAARDTATRGSGETSSTEHRCDQEIDQRKEGFVTTNSHSMETAK